MRFDALVKNVIRMNVFNAISVSFSCHILCIYVTAESELSRAPFHMSEFFFFLFSSFE